MPLQLQVSKEACYDLPKRVVWNPALAPDVMQATSTIDRLKAEGFTLESMRPGEAVLQPPSAPEDTILLRVLDDNGDSRLVWNRRRPEEVSEARKRFDALLAKGYRAYVCRSDGSKGSRVQDFDALMEEVIMSEDKAPKLSSVPRGAPPTASKPPASKQAVMVPPTRPG